MSSEAAIELQQKADTIPPESIGLQSGPYTALTEVDIRAIEQQVRILTAAQALLQVINTQPNGLVIRDMYVQYDLLEPSAGAVIASGDWRQPITGNYGTATGDVKGSPVPVYITGINSRFNLKVFTIYGFEVVRVGNARSNKITVSNSILLKRGNVKLIDIIDIQSIDTRTPPILILRTPIIYKAADDANILFTPNAADAADGNKFDTIKILAAVVETLGASQTG